MHRPLAYSFIQSFISIADKIQDGGGRHIEIHILVSNSVTNACICNEFDTEAESRVLEPDLPSKFTFVKKSICGGHHFEMS